MNIQNDNWAVASRFGLVAERFCSLKDSAATPDRTKFLVQVYRMLPDLIGEAIRLLAEEYDDDADDDPETPMYQFRPEARIKHEEWDQLYRALKEKLGDWNLYWQVFDPTKDNEAIHGTLADDLAGIYCDLKDGIRLVEQRQAPAEDIIDGWRNGFDTHWGRHAINALKTIHVLLEDTFTGLNRSD